MKKIVLILYAILATTMAKGQIVKDYFQVGPYEVDYLGKGDVNFRLRKGVDLYEYFGLKKDTVINKVEMKPQPVKNAFQLDVFMALPRYVEKSCTNVFGVDGVWKFNIANGVYFNTGLSFALAFSKYDAKSATMIQAGIPLMFEFANVDNHKSSLYCGVGLIPKFYSNARDNNDANKSGLLIAPKIETGAYVPFAGQLVRLGGFVNYDINCSGGDYDAFKERYGRLYVGANIGLVF